MIRLEASIKTGYLYHFTGTWENLNDIVNDGLLPSSDNEHAWVTDPRIKADEANQYQFASFTRNPSAVTGQHSWKYGIICDAEKLTTDYVMHPYSYWVRPGVRRVIIRQGSYGGGSGVRADEDWDTMGNDVRLSSKEIHSIYNWAKRLEKTGAVKMEEVKVDPDDRYDEFEDTDPDYEYRIMIMLGDTRNHSIPEDGSTPSYISINELNEVAYKILSQSPSESEERLYTKEQKPDEVINIKDSLVGVLVPDVDYISSGAEAFRQLHPHLPMYIYYDKNAFGQRRNMWNEVLRLNPELKTLYKFPR